MTQIRICPQCASDVVWVKMAFTDHERAAITYALARLAGEIQANPCDKDPKPPAIYSAIRKIMLTTTTQRARALAEFYRQDLGIETMPESCQTQHEAKNAKGEIS